MAEDKRTLTNDEAWERSMANDRDGGQTPTGCPPPYGSLQRYCDEGGVKQDAKYGPSDCRNPAVPPGDKVAVLAEELGEVARAVNGERMGRPEHGGHDLVSELVQVAALAFAWLESLPEAQNGRTAP